MVIYQNVFALFPYPPMHPSIYLLFGVVTIKGTKVVVECNEKLYRHYFEELCNQLYLMNYLFIFWNCVCLFMRLKFHEFGIISLCLKNPFTNKKNISWIIFFNTLKIWMWLLLFKLLPIVFKFVTGFNIFHKNGHMCWTIQKWFWILCDDLILNYDV
jgi:hypothetical protein